SVFAIQSKAAILDIVRSHVVSGASDGSAFSEALYLCTSSVGVTDSVIETSDPHTQFGIDYVGTACGTPSFLPSLDVTRTAILAKGTGSNTAFRLGSTAVTPSFESSALVAFSGSAFVVNGSGAFAAALAGCTLNGVGAGGRAVNIVSASSVVLTM